MKLIKEQVQKDLDALPEHYKTGDVDRLIRQYVKQKADVSALRPYILDQQQFHRIYFYVSLGQISGAEERMAFIHENLLFPTGGIPTSSSAMWRSWISIPRIGTQGNTSTLRIPSSAAGGMCCLSPGCVRDAGNGFCR